MSGTNASTVNPLSAHREWATRPADERFASVPALYEAARARRLNTVERAIETRALATIAMTDGVGLRDQDGEFAPLTHWSFDQLAAIAGAPPEYLRSLPASIVSAAIRPWIVGAASRHAPTVCRQSQARHSAGDYPAGSTSGYTMTSWSAGCSTSWPRVPRGVCRTAIRTASTAGRAFPPARTWAIAICFSSSWTETGASTIRPTGRGPVCSAASSCATATWALRPSRWTCSCFARLRESHHLGLRARGRVPAAPRGRDDRGRHDVRARRGASGAGCGYIAPNTRW